MKHKLLISLFVIVNMSKIPCYAQSSDTTQVINIPIIVHVVYDHLPSKCYEDGANSNKDLSRELIVSEIKNLHDDFMLLNPDTAQVLPKFKHLIANPHINLFLDTNYNKNGADKGIIRLAKGLHSWVGASPIVDHERYLNVYIINATHSWTINDHPWASSNEDCVYLYYCWTGRDYRLLTHETGHWLGLLHLWGTGTGSGDENSCLPGNGDEIGDTPPQQNATDTKCDHCPGDGSGTLDQACNGYAPSNFNNYMDYSGCRKMFTIEQVKRMRSVLFNQRASFVRNSSIH